MEKIPLIDNIYTNKLLVDFLSQKQDLSSFHSGSSFDEIDIDYLDNKDFSSQKRNLLVDVLSSQYKNTGLTIPDNVLKLSKKETFTITTGHQLCLFSGPQYFIHKIISIIKSSIDLNNKFPNNHFVPVFWMASEDHDFEEISSVKVFDKNIIVDKSFNKAVGTLDPLVFSSALEELKEILKNDDKAIELVQLFSESYKQSNWSNLTRHYLHHLFHKYGLVILDPNDSDLKASFKPIFSKEINDKFIFNTVTDSNYLLKNKGYKIPINPRELNLFYLTENSRDRIIYSKGIFTIGDKEFTLEKLNELLNSNPSSFSPNVLMRPIFQEFILPNIAYIGGPSEITYWLQLKNAFDSLSFKFPLLILRDHFSWIDSKSYDWWKMQGFSVADFFQSYDSLVRLGAKSDVEFDINNEKEIFNQLGDALKTKSKSIDSSFEQSTNASLRNMEKELSRLETKLLKSFKVKNEQRLAKIRKIQSKVIADGVLKERSESFISPFLNCKDDYFDKLIESSQVKDFSLKIITY